MNIAITFRNLESSDAVKEYVHDKIGRIQRFLRRPMKATVTLSHEKLEHCVEVRVSAGSERLQCSERSGDMYASIDLAMDKLERQIRAAKGAQQARKRRRGDGAGRMAGPAEATRGAGEAEED